MKKRLHTNRIAIPLALALIAACGSDSGTSTVGTDAADDSATQSTQTSLESSETSAEGEGSSEETAFEYPSEPVEITMFGSDEEPGWMWEVERAEEYMAMHPNVSLEVEMWGIFPAFDKLLVDLPAGLPQPTIYSMFEPLLAVFIENGHAAPAIPEVFGGTDQSAVTDLYVPDTLTAQMRDGVVYALPGSAPSYSLFINNDLFEAAGFSLETDIPTTWDEVAEMQDALIVEDESGRVTQKGFEFRYTAGPHWMAQIFTGMLYSLGEEPLDEDDMPTFNTPAGVQVLEAFVKNTVAPEVSNNVQTSPYQDFADEQDVMSFGGPNALAFIFTLNPSLRDRVTVAPLPTLVEGVRGGQRYSFNYVVNPNAAEAEQVVAWDFINYITGMPLERFKVLGSNSPRAGWFESAEATETLPFLDVFVEDYAASKSLPQTPNWGALQSALAAAVERSVLNGVDPAESLAQAEQEYLATIGNS